MVNYFNRNKEIKEEIKADEVQEIAPVIELTEDEEIAQLLEESKEKTYVCLKNLLASGKSFKVGDKFPASHPDFEFLLKKKSIQLVEA